MTTFDDRENAYENQFAHDEAMNFKAEARCNKLLALWAGARLAKTGADLDTYVAEVIKADFDEPGHEDVIRKVAGDLGGASSIDEVRAKRAELIVTARAEIADEG